jgi:hypothetical protein
MVDMRDGEGAREGKWGYGGRKMVRKVERKEEKRKEGKRMGADRGG